MQVTSPILDLDEELPVAGVEYEQDLTRGTITKLTLGPVDGYTPDPSMVRAHKGKKGKRGGGDTWAVRPRSPTIRTSDAPGG